MTATASTQQSEEWDEDGRTTVENQQIAYQHMETYNRPTFRPEHIANADNDLSEAVARNALKDLHDLGRVKVYEQGDSHGYYIPQEASDHPVPGDVELVSETDPAVEAADDWTAILLLDDRVARNLYGSVAYLAIWMFVLGIIATLFGVGDPIQANPFFIATGVTLSLGFVLQVAHWFRQTLEDQFD